jgi:hypothetical protein
MYNQHAANFGGRPSMPIEPFRKGSNPHLLEDAIHMGAQAFPETDYTPTEMHDKGDQIV